MNKSVALVVGLLALIGFFAVGFFPTLMLGAAVGGGYVLGSVKQKNKALEPKYYMEKY